MPWCCWAALVLCLGTFPSRAAAEDTTLQLRVAWGGGAERIWHGSVRLTQGKFADVQPLGIEANEPGSIWLSPQGIEIKERGLRAYDGLDMLVTADLEARLIVELADTAAEVAKSVEIPLRDLVDHSHNSMLDSVENRLLVARSPGDRLRVRCHRDNLVFSPGEMFKFELAAHLVSGIEQGYRYSATITGSPLGQRVWEHEYEAGAEGAETTVTIRVPEAEGVYNLTLAAMPVPTRLRRSCPRRRRWPSEESNLWFWKPRRQPIPARASWRASSKSTQCIRAGGNG